MAESFAATVWKTLDAINVNEHTEKKGNLTYLSWSWAWATLMAKYPESAYEVLPNVCYEDGTVETWMAVTVTEADQSVERRMWLPVMDHKNMAIKCPNARQISDTRMRCLVKCLAMFGLGHYIYAGEDLPKGETEPSPAARINAANSLAALKEVWDSLSVADHHEFGALKERKKAALEGKQS